MDGSVRLATEAVLLAPIVRPLLPDDGALGGVAADIFAREIARQLEPQR